MNNATPDETLPVETDVETFSSPWPGVLTEMKAFIELWFLALGNRRRPTALRVFISKALVAQSNLQPHVREFKASMPRIPDCRFELKGTEQLLHKIEIEYRR